MHAPGGGGLEAPRRHSATRLQHRLWQAASMALRQPSYARTFRWWAGSTQEALCNPTTTWVVAGCQHGTWAAQLCTCMALRHAIQLQHGLWRAARHALFIITAEACHMPRPLSCQVRTQAQHVGHVYNI